MKSTKLNNLLLLTLPKIYSIVITTCPNETDARRIAKVLVEDKLVACAQLIPMQSIYKWKGKISEEPEVLLLLKTRKELFPKLEQKIKEIHLYEIPEIIQVPITAGHLSYLNWIDESTS